MTVTLPKWLEYIETQIGFILPKNQHRWVENAILATASEHNLSIAQLWTKVKYDQSLNHELIDAVLILESRFFRHKPSISFITKRAKEWQQSNYKYVSKSQQHASNGLVEPVEVFRIWSIGCSEGQEAWSLAMSITNENIKDFHILGSDISTKAIKSAKKAKYTNRHLVDIPNSCHKYIKSIDVKKVKKTKCKELINVGRDNSSINTYQKQSKYWQIDTKLKKNVTFTLNNVFLAHHDSKQTKGSSQFLRSHDIIICQNMLIYFRQFDQRDILNRLVEQCTIGGHIVLAPGEALFWKHRKMQRVESNQVNAWKRIE